MAKRAVWPGHGAPVHMGWKVWCPKCRDLKQEVDAMTGGAMAWTEQERRIPKGWETRVSLRGVG
jgi:hypothetical protein